MSGTITWVITVARADPPPAWGGAATNSSSWRYFVLAGNTSLVRHRPRRAGRPAVDLAGQGKATPISSLVLELELVRGGGADPNGAELS